MKPAHGALGLTVSVLLAGIPIPTLAVDGLTTRPSAHSADETIQRFEAAARKRGFMIFSRLDHAAAAADMGLKMPRSTVIVFGNPKLGTPVFVKTPTVAIDLPLKSMVWEDADGKVYLSYNTADYLNNTLYVRHGAAFEKDGTARIEQALTGIADEAVK